MVWIATRGENSKSENKAGASIWIRVKIAALHVRQDCF